MAVSQMRRSKAKVRPKIKSDRFLSGKGNGLTSALYSVPIMKTGKMASGSGAVLSNSVTDQVVS